MADDSILRSPRELGLQKIESLGASPTFSVPSTPSGVIGLTPRSKVNPVLTPYVDVPGLQPVKTATGGGSIFGDLWASFAGGSNALLKMAGDFYGLATGDFDNWASNAGRSGQEYWEGTKSADQKDAESRRKQAVDAAQDELGKAWAYIRETVTSPRLLSTAISEQVPMLVVPGGVGAATGKAVLGQQLAKGAGKAAATAAAGKAGVAAAVGTGAVMQGADVGGDQAAELGKILAAMPQEQAMQIPEIAELVRRGASLDEAKAAYGLVQARKTAAAAGAISVGTQMLPGGRAIERALVGQGGRVGSRAGGAAVAGLGESVQEGGEEGGGLLAKNALAQGADPGRPITQNLGETVGQAVVVGGVPGAAAGFASARPPAPAATEPGTDLSGQPPGGGVPPQLTDQTRKQLPYTPEPREKVEGEVVDTPLLPPPGAPPAGAGPGLLGYTPDPDMAPRMIVDPATGQARPMSQQEIEEAVIKERVAQSVAAEAARLDVELGLTPDVRRAQQAPRYAVPEFDPAIHTGNPNRFNLPWQSQSVAASAARRLGGEVIQVQGGWAVNLPPPDPNRQAQDAAAEAADYRQATATPQTFGAPPQTGDNTTRGRIPFEDERLQRPEVRAALQAMSEEAGWEQQGGRIIREIRDDGLEAQVTGRTTWIGPDWYRVMQQDRTSNVPGGQRGVQALVKRALAGEPLTLQERRSMAYLTTEAEQGSLEQVPSWMDEETEAYYAATGNDPQDVRAAVDALVAEANAQGVDIEDILEDLAREYEGKSDEAYESALAAALERRVGPVPQSPVATEPGGQDAGIQGSGEEVEPTAPPAYDLINPTPDSLRARELAQQEAERRAAAPPPETFRLEGQDARTDQKAAEDAGQLPIDDATLITTKEQYREFQQRYGMPNKALSKDGTPTFGKGPVVFIDDDTGRTVGRTEIDPSDLPGGEQSPIQKEVEALKPQKQETEQLSQDDKDRIDRFLKEEAAKTPEQKREERFAENREALKDIKIGQKVRFYREGTFTNKDGTKTEGRWEEGTVLKIDDKEQGRVKVDNWSVGAAQLQVVEEAPAPKPKKSTVKAEIDALNKQQEERRKARGGKPGPAQRMADRAAEREKLLDPTNSLSKTTSWVIREKATGKVMFETFDKAKVDALNTAKYEAAPIGEYLGSLNKTDAAKMEAAKAKVGGALDELASLLGAKKNITPEQRRKLLPVLTDLMSGLFDMGYLSFKSAARRALELLRETLGGLADEISLRQLKAAYNSAAEGVDGTDSEAVVNATESLEGDDVSGGGADLEQDRGVGADQQPDVGQADADERGAADGGTQPSRGAAGGDGVRITGNPFVPDGGSTAGGEPGDLTLDSETGGSESAESAAGDSDADGSGEIGVDGVQPDDTPDDAIDEVVEATADFERRLAAQKKALGVPHKSADPENIKRSLPLLLDGQQEDVVKAEQRFAKPTGYGILFTNGTGTGKTYTGLGVVYRFATQLGRNNILIVAPGDKVIEDWIHRGSQLGLDIKRLSGIKDAGRGIVITTYENLGQNEALVGRDWDLVVSDEAHKLMQSEGKHETTFLQSLRALTLHPRGIYERTKRLHGDVYDEMKRLGDHQKELSDKQQRATGDEFAKVRAEMMALEPKLRAIHQKWELLKNEVHADVMQKQGAARPRFVALSATPFAYREGIDWAEGFLFDYSEGAFGDDSRNKYNQGNHRDQFFMRHFGYRMRYNKLTKPDAKVDTGLMERTFNGWMKKNGVLSARGLDVPFDYDRRFQLIDSAIGKKIDEALAWLGHRDHPERRPLHALINAQFDYNRRTALLERIKAQSVIPLIKQHLEKGRKVVVFHERRTSKHGQNDPFSLPIEKGTMVPSPKGGEMDIFEIYQQFRSEFPELYSAGFRNMPLPVEQLTKAFQTAAVYNGDAKAKKARLKGIERFNTDGSGTDVVVIQTAAGKEGISAHDTTGAHPRVLFNLGLPVAPVTAIQQEGRIFRVGQASNAFFRYLNTGTNWERWAFADKIATRVGTAENLSQGEAARGLKDAFIIGFEESGDYPAGYEGEGTGGKAADKALVSAITPYERAKSFYWATKKKAQQDKAREGNDYYPTPEPLGFKMVEWLGLQPGERALEPSAGHGAIARWFPELTDNTAIEQSNELGSRLAMAFSGKVINDTFESHEVINKYDGIAMNPPYNYPNGHGGKLAMEHVAKAYKHLRAGGRMIAIIPDGPAMDKRIEQWLYGTTEKELSPKLRDDRLGDLYEGDVFAITWYGRNTTGRVIRKASEGDVLIAKIEGVVGESRVPPSRIDRIITKGPRTEQVSETKDATLVATISLPTVTFERAATLVKTKMLVIDKALPGAQPSQGVSPRDLSGITAIGELFDRLENMTLPPRPQLPEGVESAPKRQAKPADAMTTWEQTHGQTGETQFMANFSAHVSREEYLRVAAIAGKHGGYWSRFENAANKVKKGFAFKTAEARQGFLDANRPPAESRSAFAAWFGNSKVVDADGKPLRVYHGTWAQDFKAFGGVNYFTDDPAYANFFASDGNRSRIIPVYLSLQKPLDARSLGSGDLTLDRVLGFLRANGIESAQFERKLRDYKPNDLPPFWELFGTSRGLVDEFKRAGFDGLILRENIGKHVVTAYVNFEPQQIKSATGNSGAFDPASPDITESRGQAVSGISVSAARRVVETFMAQFPSVRDNMRVEVVEQVDDIPAEHRPSPFAEGVYHAADGVIYIVAGNIASEARAAQVMAHEVIGHYGVEALLGSKFDSVLEQIQKMTAEMEAVRKAYPDASPSELAREVLARIAETDSRPTFLEMLYMKLRAALRKLGFDLGLTNADLKQMIVDAAKMLREGRTPSMMGARPAAESRKSGTGEEASRLEEARELRKSLKERAAAFINRMENLTEPLRTLPNYAEYLRERYLALGKVAEVEAMVEGVRDVFRGANTEDEIASFKYLTTKGASPEGIKDAAVRNKAIWIKGEINKIGDKLVQMGLLSEESRATYADAYLPRLYLRHLLNQQDWISLGAGKKPSNLGYLKQRKDIPEGVRRIILGEITDPGYLSAQAIGKPLRDMALLEWLERISQNVSWVLPKSFVNWRGKRVSAFWLAAEAEQLRAQADFYTPENAAQARKLADRMEELARVAKGDMAATALEITQNYKQIPNTPRYGRMRGVYVRREIYDDLMGINDFQPSDETFWGSIFGYGGAGTKLTGWWKTAKVALNIPAQARNFVSNTVLLNLSGVPLRRIVQTLIRATQEIKSNGRYWQIAKKYGVTEATFAANELANANRDLLELEKNAGALSTLGHMKLAAAVVSDWAGDIYQKLEALFKTAKIIDAMEHGKLDEAAAAIEAHKWLFDYSLVSREVRYMRNAPVGTPFLTFTIKVLPRMLEVASQHPERLLPYVGFFLTIPYAVAAMTGVDADDLDKLHLSLPKWMRERGHIVILPFKDEDGRWQVVDLGYFMPWSFYTDLVPVSMRTARRGLEGDVGAMSQSFSDDLASANTIAKATSLFGGPIPDLMVALKTNRDAFTGREIVPAGANDTMKAVAAMSYLYDMMLPPMLTSRGFVSPFGLIDRELGGKAVQAAYGDTNRFGEPRATPLQAALYLPGVNLYGVDQEKSRAGNIMQLRREIEDAQQLLVRKLQNRALSDEERQEIIERHREEIAERIGKLQEYVQRTTAPAN